MIFQLNRYESISFCHADCVKTSGLATFAHPGGVYDQCTICGNGVTTDHTVCTPVFNSAGCPGEGDQLSGVKPSADACRPNQAPRFVSPTPGISGEDGATPDPAYPARPTVTAHLGSDIIFDVAVEDPDSCSELEIRVVNAPDDTALLTNVVPGAVDNPTAKATFVWPAPSIEASLDNRPRTSVVCFYAFDKYVASLDP